jgi:hypothetical protein
MTVVLFINVTYIIIVLLKTTTISYCGFQFWNPQMEYVPIFKNMIGNIIAENKYV